MPYAALIIAALAALAALPRWGAVGAALAFVAAFVVTTWLSDYPEYLE